MNLSLGKIFKKEKETAPAKEVAPPVEKPASERLRKTVMPSASREIELPEPAPYRAPEPIAPLSAPRSISLGAEPFAPPPAPVVQLPAPLAPRPTVKLPSLPPLAPSISTHGTGVPATERVPASSGSPVPTPLPAPFAPRLAAVSAGPLHIPPLKPVAVAQNVPSILADDGRRIHLSLRAILRGIPPFQFEGAIEDIPETAEIEVPVAMVEPQLSLGRVAISPAQFHAAMPEEYRALFKVDEGGLPVSLPLAQVLENLPNESLRIRGDQEEAEMGEVFETSFGQKAAEDAARLHLPVGPIAKPADPIAEGILLETESLPAERSALQLALGADEEPLDAKSIVAQVSQLPGLSACAIIFSDGLSLAGNIPEEYEVEALCALAPEMMKRIDERMSRAHLGALRGVTLFCAKAPMSFFAEGNICLAALHSGGQVADEIRDRLVTITAELAQLYAQPPNA